MESKQQVPNEAIIESCFFSGICRPIFCVSCSTKGLSYLASKAYIPKTLIPLSYHRLKLSDLELNDEVSSEVSYYLDNIARLVGEGKGFYAYSTKTGTGKTSVGCLALKHYLYWSIMRDPYDTDNRRVLYINTPEFLDRIRKSFNSPDLELEKLLEELMTLRTAPKLVLFDDLGAEKPSDWVRERLYTLINFRVANGLASLYTGNMTLDHLVNQLGSRVVSRIKGSSKILLFPGRDRRKCDW